MKLLATNGLLLLDWNVLVATEAYQCGTKLDTSR